MPIKTLFAALALTLTSAAQEPLVEEIEGEEETLEVAEAITVPEATEETEAEEATEISQVATEILKEVVDELAEVTEHAITTGPFSIKSEISGILIPTKTQTLRLSPERWKTFTIQSVPPHGAEINAAEPLIVFKTEPIDKALVEEEEKVKMQELKLAIANRELTELQQKNALTLAGAKRQLDNAEADLAYHQSTALPARKEALAQSQLRAEDSLSYQKEELTQLLKMYEEDDITEETEEIILTRQKASVRNAENSLTDLKRRNARTLEIGLPRELVDMEQKIETSRIDYATAKLNLERNFEVKKLEVAKLERDLSNTRETLAKLESDRALFDVIAEFDGILVYGDFVDGQWKKGKTAEILKAGGNVPPNTTVLTLVAKDSPLAIQALLDTEKAKELQASLTESGDSAPEVTIAPFPDLNGKYLVTLPPQPAEPFQFPGQKDKTELVFYQTENAISIPRNALKTGEDGTSYVMVKLSEGDPEQRPVQLGKKNGQRVEVLSGLEVGQVILP